jgi:hypothetical protein
MNPTICCGFLLASTLNVSGVIHSEKDDGFDRIRKLLVDNEIEGRLEGIDEVRRVGRPLVADLLPLLDDQRQARNIGPHHVPYVARVSELAAFTVHELLGVMYPILLDTRYLEWIHLGLANARRLIEEPAWAAYLRSVAPFDGKAARPYPIGWFQFGSQLVSVDLFRSPDEEFLGVAITVPAAEAEELSESVDSATRLGVWVLAEDGAYLSSLDEPTVRRGLFFRNGSRRWLAPLGANMPGHVLFSFLHPPSSAHIVAVVIQNGSNIQLLPVQNMEAGPLSDEEVWLYRLNTLLVFGEKRGLLTRDSNVEALEANIVGLRNSLLRLLKELGREATYDKGLRRFTFE